MNETQQQLVERLRKKHAEGLLLWELENGFEMSPKLGPPKLVANKERQANRTDAKHSFERIDSTLSLLYLNTAHVLISTVFESSWSPTSVRR